jgi:hypothetical protein
MTAKPQRLLAHLISLLAPGKNDIVLALGDSNCVFSSVAMKLQKRFIHITGSSEEQLSIWELTGSKRIEGVLDGKDTEEIEGSDSLPEAKVKAGRIDILKVSESCLVHNQKDGSIEPFFDDDEDIGDFFAGLSGAYKRIDGEDAYTGIDKRIVVVVPEDEALDNVLLDNYRRKYSSGKLFVIYESREENLSSIKNVQLKRAPFDLL